MLRQSLVHAIKRKCIWGFRAYRTTNPRQCGLVSALVLEKNDIQSRINEHWVESGLRTLRHRGPDEFKVWTNSNNRVALGHVRLSILGLEDGHQPMKTDDGQTHMVVNGEIYDWERQKSQLQSLGFRFNTHSDSETALQLYAQKGIDFVDDLRGEFAIVLWDEKYQQQIAVRDRYGVKPLYYCTHEGKLLMASEMKAFFEMGVPAIWNMSGLMRYPLGLEYNETLFEGIYQVPPGHMLVTDNFSGRSKLVKYWDAKFPEQKQTLQKTKNPDEIIQLVREELLEAVELRMRADVPVGAYLSGGLDSCTLVGMMSHLSNKPVDVYTIAFDNDNEYCEGEVAKRMAEFSGAKMHQINITSQEVADNIDLATYHGETPAINGHTVSKFLLSKCVNERGRKVVLTGEGADEIFAGYSFFRGDIIQSLENQEDRERAFAQLNKRNAIMPVHARDMMNEDKSVYQLLDHVPGIMDGNFGPNFDWFKNQDLAQQEWDMRKYRALQVIASDKRKKLKNANTLDRSLYQWQKSVLPFYLLTNLGDRMEMAHSVEGRVPFLDHKLSEYVNTLNQDMKVRDGVEKYALREAAKPFINDEIYNRQKHPFLSPAFCSEKKSSLFEWIQATVRHSSFESSPFDQNTVIQYLDNLDPENTPMDKLRQYDVQLIAMATIGSLHRQFKVQCPENSS